MKFPNKVVSYKKSVLPKFPILLNSLGNEGKTPIECYEKVKSKVDGIAEFTKILDCLFALGKIEMLDEGVLVHVKRD